MLDKIIITPFQKFVKIESFSGILLFAATVIALIWANSPLSYLYENLWQFKLGIATQSFELQKPLILWINDGLMAIFFFLIGLEIKRELLIGELNSVKKAIFPIFAALGGMLFPLTIYIILNNNVESASGWGIPMATDIAFTLAILKLLGKRVPLSLKVFLTAFAIIDDIGAVLVIAIFYSENINVSLILYSLLPISILFFLAYKKIYSKYIFIIFASITWLLFLKSGVHPTIAGVLLAFAIPIRQKISAKTFANKLDEIVQKIKSAGNNEKDILTNSQIEQIDNLEDWTSQVQSPLQHLEHRLHNWVAYFIMPIFALSNAGVSLISDVGLDYNIVVNISLALILGNLLGVSFMSYLGIKLKLTELPSGINFKQIFGVAILAGVGFTMSIFIANLAFINNQIFIDSAKIGILIGSLISGILGYLILRSTGNQN